MFPLGVRYSAKGLQFESDTCSIDNFSIFWLNLCHYLPNFSDAHLVSRSRVHTSPQISHMQIFLCTKCAISMPGASPKHYLGTSICGVSGPQRREKNGKEACSHFVYLQKKGSNDHFLHCFL